MAEFQFNGVIITVDAPTGPEAYTRLCKALEDFEFTTDTYQEIEPGEESLEYPTSDLFPKMDQ